MHAPPRRLGGRPAFGRAARLGLAVSAFVEIDRVAKSFGATTVLRGLSLDVAEGGGVGVLGPSGSGKTTLLRLLAGFEEADAGSIRLGGADVTRLPPAKRGGGMGFQPYAPSPPR